MAKRIAVLGAGQMGMAIIRFAVSAKAARPGQIIATQRAGRLAALRRLVPRIRATADNRLAVESADIVVIAVRPDQVRRLVVEVGPARFAGKLVISIAAGVPPGGLRRLLPRSRTVIHIHPASPAVLGVAGGISFREIEPRHVPDRTDVVLARRLFGAIGPVLEARSRDLPAFIVMTGCLPALLAAFAQQLGGKSIGRRLDPRLSLLIQQNALRAVRDAAIAGKMSMAEIRKRIATPGGVTQKGVDVILGPRGDGFSAVVVDACLAKIASIRQSW